MWHTDDNPWNGLQMTVDQVWIPVLKRMLEESWITASNRSLELQALAPIIALAGKPAGRNDTRRTAA